MKNRVSKSISLKEQINRLISSRILFCLLLVLMVALLVTIYDISNSFSRIESTTEEYCSNLKNFAINQVLIGNEEAIHTRLRQVNRITKFKIIWVSNRYELKNISMKMKLPFSWIYYYPVVSTDGENLGYFEVHGHFADDSHFLSRLLLTIAFLILFSFSIFLLLYPIAKKIPAILFVEPIENIMAVLRRCATFEKESLMRNVNMPAEIREIFTNIDSLLQEVEMKSQQNAFTKMATQVAHDIRSPLAVLNFEAKNFSLMPETSRLNITNAIQRVNDIANNLLSEYISEKSDHSAKGLSSELVSTLLENIVSEKRVLILNKLIQLTLEIDPCSRNIFVELNGADFKRVLSNLINNSVDSIDSHGVVSIKQTLKSGKLSISVSDNGCGISRDKLPLILEEGISFGKKNGSGLGLPFAIDKITSWHGDYFLSSNVGEGTEFEMIFPLAKSAEWFASELNVSRHGSIVILDDDSSIHQIWDQRFTPEFVSTYQLKIYHFYDADALITFCQSQLSFVDVHFLLDYELIGDQKTGLVLAETLDITSKSILVTNRFEDNALRKACGAQGIKILPKIFAEHALISILPQQTDIVFIDDEEILTSIWNESAKRAGKNLVTFNDPDEFMSLRHSYPKNTKIYLDSSFGGHLKGEDIARILFEEGYSNVIITTGYPREKFMHLSWIKDIVGKEPPWG